MKLSTKLSTKLPAVLPTRRSVAVAAAAALAGVTIGVVSAEAIPPPGGNGKPQMPPPPTTTCTATLESTSQWFFPVEYRAAVKCSAMNTTEKVRPVLTQKYGKSQVGAWFMSTGPTVHYTEWAVTQHHNDGGPPVELGAVNATFEVAKR